MAKAKLQIRKQQLVKDAIYDAAVELFAAQGFDETTVEEVALAAGISRRSFFRYYETKDDLLAQSVLNYGTALTSSIAASAANMAPLALLRETVVAGLRHAQQTHLTRQIIEIAQRSNSARRAYASRMAEVEDSLAAAYSTRFKGSTQNGLKPRLMANLTQSLLSAAIVSWYSGESRDLLTCSKQAFDCLHLLMKDADSPSPSAKSTAKARQIGKSTPKKSIE